MIDTSTKTDTKSISETIALIKNPPSKKFKANLTAIEDIKPISTGEKISESIAQVSMQGEFDRIKDKIQIK